MVEVVLGDLRGFIFARDVRWDALDGQAPNSVRVGTPTCWRARTRCWVPLVYCTNLNGI